MTIIRLQVLGYRLQGYALWPLFPVPGLLSPVPYLRFPVPGLLSPVRYPLSAILCSLGQTRASANFDQQLVTVLEARVERQLPATISLTVQEAQQRVANLARVVFAEQQLIHR